jgi:hypothetical protein
MRIPTSASFGRFFHAAGSLTFTICLAAPAMAKRAVPENLGNGLDKLVETNLALKAGLPRISAASPQPRLAVIRR